MLLHHLYLLTCERRHVAPNKEAEWRFQVIRSKSCGVNSDQENPLTRSARWAYGVELHATWSNERSPHNVERQLS